MWLEYERCVPVRMSGGAALFIYTIHNRREVPQLNKGIVIALAAAGAFLVGLRISTAIIEGSETEWKN